MIELSWSDYSFSFQRKSCLWGFETVGRAHNIGIQHVNMSPEQVAHHFTLFLDVLRVLLSVSELSWSDLNLKKRYEIKASKNQFF